MQIIQMRKKGGITLPAELRRRYRLEEGDPVTIIDLGEGIFISPRQSTIPKLVSEIEALREKHNVSLDELIDGVAKMREKSR